MADRYAGAGWLRSVLIIDDRGDISPLGIKVADILGQVYRGIYHIQRHVLSNNVDWSDKYCIALNIRGGLYSFDSQRLTELLVLCFDNMIRLEINPKSWSTIQLVFHQRSTRDRSAPLGQRLPTIETMITNIRGELSLPEVD